MKRRKNSILILKMCVCLGILAAALLGQRLWQERREEDKIYSLWIQADDREISKEFLQQIAQREGVKVVSAAWEIPVYVSIDSYEMDAVLLAVDMNVVPAAVKKCADRLETGNKVPMYLGADSLDGLADENGYPITKKQKELLFEHGIGREMALQGIGGMEEAEEPLKAKTQIGIWAAELKDAGTQIWVTMEEGQKLADSLNITRKDCKIYVEVKGGREYQNLCSALEQAEIVLHPVTE